MDRDQLFIKRALELAENGAGNVSPNPMVGCVVVHEGKILGEGWHMEYGGPHAEVNALNAVKDRNLLPESTVYVSLEPCSHFGKTPPCADLLIREKVKRVVICNVDNNPQVEGTGIARLKEAGVEVEYDILSEEGKSLNKRFFTFMEQKRPFVILKWAETADGFIARENFDSKWISNEFSRQLVHKWRSEEAAILVGTNTALHDDPMLNVRDWSGKDPLRLVIDSKLRLPGDLKLFNSGNKPVVYNFIKSGEESDAEYVKVNAENVLEGILEDLYQRKILSLLVEGGAQVLEGFIHAGVWDEARIFKSGQMFEKGIPSPNIRGSLRYVEDIMGDKLFWYSR